MNTAGGLTVGVVLPMRGEGAVHIPVLFRGYAAKGVERWPRLEAELRSKAWHREDIRVPAIVRVVVEVNWKHENANKATNAHKARDARTASWCAQSVFFFIRRFLLLNRRQERTVK